MRRRWRIYGRLDGEAETAYMRGGGRRWRWWRLLREGVIWIGARLASIGAAVDPLIGETA
jgi:hypothetical protein